MNPVLLDSVDGDGSAASEDLLAFCARLAGTTESPRIKAAKARARVSMFPPAARVVSLVTPYDTREDVVGLECECQRVPPMSEDISEELKTFMTQAVPYWRTLGLELKELEQGRAVFEAESRPDLMQNTVIHGGVLASIADSACAVAGISRVYPANYASTINLQIAYLKPLLEGRFRAEGRCLKAGKKILFCEAVVVDDKKDVICTASSQLMVIPWKGGRSG